MTAINAGRGERNTILLQTNVGHDKRRVTDKRWYLLCFASYCTLALLWPLVLERDDTTQCQDHSDSSTVTNKTLEIPNKQIDKKIICENITLLNATIEYAMTHVWGKNWLLDAITLNVGFLDANYKEGFIAIWAHVVMSVCLIIYSFASMRTNHLYCRQMEIFVVFFVLISICIRIVYSKNNAIHSDKLLWFWSVPELILLIIVFMKSPSLQERNTRLPEYLHFGAGPLVFLYIFFFSIPPILSALSKYKLQWDNRLSYVFVGVICYACLILYYYVLMVMAYATTRSLDRGRRMTNFGDFFRAWLIIAGYHFGTVCYHATLIIPRIHATFIMFEREFKENRELSLAQRIYLTHWKIPNLVSTMTAARGHDSSSSIRELLRLFSSDSPRLDNYQNYNRILRTFSALLIAINSLLVISLWAHGVALDPIILMSLLLSYLLATLIQYLFARCHDSVADAYWLYLDRRDVAEF